MLGVALLIRSIQLLPVAQRSPSTSHSSSENTRADKIRDRLKALNIKEASFNAQVDELFYAKHPDLNKRQQRVDQKITLYGRRVQDC